jgi:hypothetical protein
MIILSWRGDLYAISSVFELSCGSLVCFPSFSAQLDIPSTHDLSSMTMERGKIGE